MHESNTRQRYSDEEKQILVDLWRRSRQTRAEFCRQNHLNIKTFENWTAQFKSSEVELIPAASEIDLFKKEDLDFELRFPSGLRCHLHTDIFNVARLIGVYEQCK